MATKFDFSAFNVELFNSEKSLTATVSIAPRTARFVCLLLEIKKLFCSYSASVVYTKTIIHLSVGESGGYLPRREYPPLFISTSVNNC